MPFVRHATAVDFVRRMCEMLCFGISSRSSLADW